MRGPPAARGEAGFTARTARIIRIGGTVAGAIPTRIVAGRGHIPPMPPPMLPGPLQ
jgi:hypothetical protein